MMRQIVGIVPALHTLSCAARVLVTARWHGDGHIVFCNRG